MAPIERNCLGQAAAKTKISGCVHQSISTNNNEGKTVRDFESGYLYKILNTVATRANLYNKNCSFFLPFHCLIMGFR